MSGNALMGLTVGAIALLLFLILYCRLHAFLALLLSAMALGLSAGMPPVRVLKSIQSGFGEALGFIAVVLALGSMIGRFLEHSGGGRSLADWLLTCFGRDRAIWAVLVAAFLIGLPIFFEVGFIILAPLAWSLARESKKSLLYFGLPIACALTVTHAMVPPHPAPAAAAQLLGADLGRIILYGSAVAIPMAISGGVLYGVYIARRMFVPVPSRAEEGAGRGDGQAPPSPGVVALVLTLPVILISAATAWGAAQLPGVAVMNFVGHPFTALTLTALVSMWAFGFHRGLDRAAVGRMSAECLAPIGSLLAIMGGGGAFKQVIVDSGVGEYAGKLLAASSVSPLILVYLVAAGMRVAQGSATVAIITAAGIVAPAVRNLPGYSPEMLVLALCCGGTILSHVNDAGFWLVNQMFEMTVPQTLKSWTVMKVITSVVGISIVLAAQAILR
jgi:gluconate transporter